ncbi:taste receptor type 2 member 7-like [Trichosurus vulpecula]|uniref:taste receptor type 2 member 7-like n=1 Tax=Trichosurus vulpecula TaxID=9337 RepID=UPI00186ACDFE|nr:taste receptor type 2 member 7-like [Trichosurus vulpecula]
MENIYATVASGEFFFGVLVNVFMGLVNSMDWAKTRRVSTLDFIITGMAISRTILLWTIISVTILVGFYFNENIKNKLRIMNILWHLGSVLSAWFDACLGVFFFLKIANFSYPVFLWLKWRVDKVVIRVLIVCMIISLLICLPGTEKMHLLYFDQRNKANITENIQVSSTYYIFPIIFFYIGSFPPFFLCLTSCFLLVLSLWRHTQQIQLHVTSSRDPSTEAHVKAMKFMVSFLFLFVLYHVGIITAVLNFSVFRNHLGIMFGMIIMNIYPMAHSIILILWNSKLRQASLRVLQKLKHCLRNSC